MILDLKKSGVKRTSRMSHRVTLPRATYAVHDLLKEAAAAQAQHDPDMLVVDATDAFDHVPLHPDERQLFSTIYRNRVLVWQRAAQGSRNGP